MMLVSLQLTEQEVWQETQRLCLWHRFQI